MLNFELVNPKETQRQIIMKDSKGRCEISLWERVKQGLRDSQKSAHSINESGSAVSIRLGYCLSMN